MQGTANSPTGALGSLLLVFVGAAAFFVIVGVTGLAASIVGTLVFAITNIGVWLVRRSTISGNT